MITKWYDWPREEIDVTPEVAKLFKESEFISSKTSCLKLKKDKVEGLVDCFDQVESANERM